MNQDILEGKIGELGLAHFDYFEQISSTNDAAHQWLKAGNKGLYLAVADEQLKGRGRDGRAWQTPAKSALAFSLAISQEKIQIQQPALITGLAAIAICKVLERHFGLAPTIKWPNDILIEGKKVGGILTEASWDGDQLKSLIIGIGINVAQSSIAEASQFLFPASYLEAWLEKAVDRAELLTLIVAALLEDFDQLEGEALINEWEARLAYRNEIVDIVSGDVPQGKGKLLGLDQEGRAILEEAQGQISQFAAGEIRLRPLLAENKD